MIRLSILAFLSAAALAATPAFAAGDAGKEIATAIQHSGYASQVKSTEQVHLHLHHVVNCLVGPEGKGFYPEAGDPCKGMGNGALNDLNGQPKVRAELEKALREADKGLRESGFKTAHRTAERVRKTLKVAQSRYTK
jgi:hypothetical protein